MSDNTNFQTLYSKEWVSRYEQKMSWLRGTVAIEGEVKGNTFIFNIEGAADEAKERGANGMIPYASDGQGTETCTLKEYHHLAKKNNFNVFSAAPDQRGSMQRRGIVSVNKRTDQLIIDQLEATTFTTGAAAVATLSLLLRATSVLDENDVPDDGERYGVLTPRAWAQAMKVEQFSSGDFVTDKPYMKAVQWRLWNGVKWARHTNLPNKGLATAKCFVYHKWSVGHAMNMGEMQNKTGVDEQHDYSWARSSSYQGSKLLQAGGVVQINHDDSVVV